MANIFKGWFEGDLFVDKLMTTLLMLPDASVYRKANASSLQKRRRNIKKTNSFLPESTKLFYRERQERLLPDNVLVNGILVDVSKNLPRYYLLMLIKKRFTVQPGVIRERVETFIWKHMACFLAQHFYLQPLYDRGYGR